MNYFLQFITFQKQLRKQKMRNFVMIRFLLRPTIIWVFIREYLPRFKIGLIL